MTKTVLIEGHNLTLEAGTGIATYARVLGETLRGIGHATDVLISTRRSIDTRDPLLGEIALHDAAAGLPRPLGHKLSLAARQVIGSPRGVRPATVRPSGTVVDAAGGRLAGFGRVHAIRDLGDVSRFHFKRWNRPLRVKLHVRPDLFHMTCPMPLHVRGCPNIVTIHDLIPLRLPSATLDDKKYFLDLVRTLARRADHIVTVSAFSRADIIQLLGVPEKRVTNTYQSVHMPKALLDRSPDVIAREIEDFFGLEPGGYFLFVGAIEPKKNISRLIDAYASSGSKRPLVIVGQPAWQYERDLEKIEDERFRVWTLVDGHITAQRRVRRLAYLPFPRLVSLMQGARAVLFPSLYEGFGLPVLEAMLVGTPVLTSNTSSLPEVAGDAALLVDPHDVDAIASGIRTLDHDDALCADLARRGQIRAEMFSPERYRDRLAALYAGLI
jgi:glycosyltransferase involved in cell wall biosynthesis